MRGMALSRRGEVWLRSGRSSNEEGAAGFALRSSEGQGSLRRVERSGEKEPPPGRAARPGVLA